jgi:hypothetical protein
MALMGKLKAAAVVTVAAVGFHAYQSGAAATPAHHGGSAESSAALPAGPVTRNGNEALANRMAASGYGWRGGEATCLDELWTEESGFSSTAYNASSGATGIPQLLPGAHKIPANWSDPATQIRWGLSYIAGRYGTPCAAWAHERSQSPNWY